MDKIVLTPPHDQEIEKAVLGAIFLSVEAFDNVVDILSSEDFYITTHQNIFAQIKNFHKSYGGSNIDYVSFKAFLEKENALEKCGGEEVLFSFASGDFTCSNIDIYAKMLIEKSVRRKLLKLSQDIKNRVFDQSEESNDIVDKIEKDFTDISQKETSSDRNFAIGSDLVTDVAEAIIDGRKTRSIPSGFTTLDSYTSGFRGGEMIIIGARPGIGKTAFSLSMMLSMIQRDVKVGFFSLEMSGEQLLKRLFSNKSQIPFKKIRDNRLDKPVNGEGESKDAQRLLDAAEILSECDFYIQDEPNMKLSHIKSQARKMKREHNIDILMIDYIGLISVESDSKNPRYEQVRLISQSIKQLARELDVPIIMLSQVTRDSENNEPNLANLRESGAIEQDADAVIFLHRERKTKIEEQKEDIQKTKLILAKQRSGETGSFNIGFEGKYVRFVNLENPY